MPDGDTIVGILYPDKREMCHPKASAFGGTFLCWMNEQRMPLNPLE